MYGEHSYMHVSTSKNRRHFGDMVLLHWSQCMRYRENTPSFLILNVVFAVQHAWFFHGVQWKVWLNTSASGPGFSLWCFEPMQTSKNSSISLSVTANDEVIAQRSASNTYSFAIVDCSLAIKPRAKQTRTKLLWCNQQYDVKMRGPMYWQFYKT